MRNKIVSALLILGLSSLVCGQGDPQYVGGDIVRFIEVGSEDNQILRNQGYFSVSLHSVYLYYNSGFFDKLKWVAVQSDIRLEKQPTSAEGAMIHATRRKRNEGDFIGLNDHLVVLTPAFPSRIQYQVSFKGIGEDKFKGIFDLLSGSDLKIPLNLAQATLAKVNIISGIIRKFTASPYTKESPKGILKISHSLLLYPNKNPSLDALRQGFYAIISARDTKDDRSANLSFLLTSPDTKLSVHHRGLYYNGRPFLRNSYVILAVTASPRRGVDEQSAWHSKYSAAKQVSDKLLRGAPFKIARDEALDLWEEGNVLLRADPNYIEVEKTEIRDQQLAEIKTRFQKAAGQVWETNEKVFLEDPRVPPDFQTTADKYNELLDKQPPQSGVLSIRVVDSTGAVLPGTHVEVAGRNVITNEDGVAVLLGVKPGEHYAQPVLPGFSLGGYTVIVNSNTIQTTEIVVSM